MSEARDLLAQGLWKNNSALVQLLGLCPLLAVSSTATNALGLVWPPHWYWYAPTPLYRRCAVGCRMKSASLSM